MGDPVAALNKPAYRFVASGGKAAATSDDGDNGEFWFISSCFMFAKMFAWSAAMPREREEKNGNKQRERLKTSNEKKRNGKMKVKYKD